MIKDKKKILLPLIACLTFTLAACGNNIDTTENPGSEDIATSTTDILDSNTNTSTNTNTPDIEEGENLEGAIDISPYKKHKLNYKSGENIYSFKLTSSDKLKIHFRSLDLTSADAIESVKLFDANGIALTGTFDKVDEDNWSIFEPSNELKAGTYFIKVKVGQLNDATKATSTLEINSIKSVDLVMFMGQSNMAGRGVADEATLVTPGHGFEFKAISDPSKLYDAKEPFGQNENNSHSGVSETKKTGSMVTSIMEEYYQHTQIPMVGVSCSVGGTSIEQWSPTGKFVADAFARFDSAKEFLNNNNYKIRNNFAVWCQGETDGDNKMAKDTYKEKLEGLVDAFFDKGLTSTYVVRIGRYNSTPERLDEAYKLIRYAQSQTCYEKDTAVLASTQFYRMKNDGLMKDKWHYKQEAYNIVGKETGTNIAYHINTEKQPIVHDYEYGKDYDPYSESILPEVPGIEIAPAQDFTLTFDTVKEGTYDWSNIGTIENGGLHITTPQKVKLANPIVMKPDKAWTLQFKTKATSDEANGTILTEGENASDAFINLPDTNKTNTKYNGFTISDSESYVKYLFKKNIDKVNDINTFVMTYDGKKSIHAYQNGIEITGNNIIKKGDGSAKEIDITFNYLFGGFDSKYDYKGTIYHLQYNTRVLGAEEFIK